MPTPESSRSEPPRDEVPGAVRPRIGIVVGSTRPGRKAEVVARWVEAHARARTDAAFEVVDVEEFHLPLLDEPIPASAGRYQNAHTKAWAAKISSFDGFVFVTPEYNHATSAALKNAIDFVYAEWNNKAAGFVGYGSAGGVRAVENLRLIMAELQVADVRSQVRLGLREDFVEMREFRPGPGQAGALTMMLDQLVAWSRALAPLRARPG